MVSFVAPGRMALPMSATVPWRRPVITESPAQGRHTPLLEIDPFPGFPILFCYNVG
jgi:hypothetical protein